MQTQTQKARFAQVAQEVRQDCERAVEFMDVLTAKRQAEAVDQEAVATWEAIEKVSRLTHELRNAVWERADNGQPLTETERHNLMAVRATIKNLLDR